MVSYFVDCFLNFTPLQSTADPRLRLSSSMGYAGSPINATDTQILRTKWCVQTGKLCKPNSVYELSGVYKPGSLYELNG